MYSKVTPQLSSESTTYCMLCLNRINFYTRLLSVFTVMYMHCKKLITLYANAAQSLNFNPSFCT